MSQMGDIREEIRAATDIARLVGGYVQLKRSGHNYVGLCPFHNERTPSFYVSPTRGTFKCFGCGKGGDVFAFVMEMESLTFPEAMRHLAARANIKIPERTRSRAYTQRLEHNKAVLNFADAFFRERWSQIPENNPLQQIDLTEDTIRVFGLGYAPADGRSLVEAADNQAISEKALGEAGLTPSNDQEDLLRGAITFPLHSKVGKINGFMAHVLETGGEIPILNRRLFSPRRILFGIYQAKSAIRTAEEVILVRRISDVLAMHQVGIKHVVSSSCGMLTPEQVQILGQLTKRLLLVHDGRLPETNATRRAINVALAGGMRVAVVSLPQGMGPTEVIIEDGAEELKRELVEQRKDFIDFLVSTYRQSSAQSMHAIATAITNIADPVMKDFSVDHAVKKLKVDTGEMRKSLEEAQEARVFQVAAEIFQDQLYAADGAVRRDYIQKRLEIDETTVQAFGLGYAPDRWGTLVSAAQARGIEVDALLSAGLAIRSIKEDRQNDYDLFRKRLMIPIMSDTGYVVAFIGIGIGGSKTDNANRTERATRFEGSEILYGFCQSEPVVREWKEVLVVERFRDVWGLHTRGIRNVVALMGNRLSKAQADRLSQRVSVVKLAKPKPSREDRRIGNRVGMSVEHVSWGAREAYEVLIQRAGYGETDIRVLLQKALDFALGYFQYHLSKDAKARRYLEDRGLKPKTIKQFCLGYAPNRRSLLLRKAKEFGIESDVLEQAGLIRRSSDRSPYEVFRGRVMFPIFSGSGKVIGFGGRILEARKRAPKYLNTQRRRSIVRAKRCTDYIDVQRLRKRRAK